MISSSPYVLFSLLLLLVPETGPAPLTFLSTTTATAVCPQKKPSPFLTGGGCIKKVAAGAGPTPQHSTQKNLLHDYVSLFWPFSFPPGCTVFPFLFFLLSLLRKLISTHFPHENKRLFRMLPCLFRLGKAGECGNKSGIKKRATCIVFPPQPQK